MPEISPDQVVRLAEFGTHILALLLLGWALYQLRMVTTSALDTIKEQADEIPGKRLLIKKAQWDYVILVAGVLVVVAGDLDLLEKQTFAVFLLAVLGGLGLKIAKDFSSDARHGPHRRLWCLLSGHTIDRFSQRFQVSPHFR